MSCLSPLWYGQADAHRLVSKSVCQSTERNPEVSKLCTTWQTEPVPQGAAVQKPLHKAENMVQGIIFFQHAQDYKSEFNKVVFSALEAVPWPFP